MVRRILLIAMFIFSFYGFAQEGTSSPYSFYGIGDFKFKGTVENRSMGGLGILSDSIHLNLQNPASLSSLKLTSFAIGTTYNNVKLQSAFDYERTKRFSFDYLAVSFPAGKLGVSFGLMPYTSVGYRNQSVSQFEDGQILKRFTGSGGLNKVFIGAAYQITPKFSAGIDFGYNFGKIESSTIIVTDGIQYGVREINTSNLNGATLNMGLSYQTKIKKYDLVSSLTLSPSTNLRNTNAQELGAITFNSSGFDVLVDTPLTNTTKSKIKMPSKVAFGAGIGHIKKWFVGFETTFQNFNNFSNLYQRDNNATFGNASKIAIGGYYIPSYGSYSGYFKRINYRAGIRYENTGLIINSQSIKDQAFTFGLGLPVGGTLSNLNFGFEMGQKGTTTSGLVKENYFNIFVGLSFTDRWFIKRRYD